MKRQAFLIQCYMHQNVKLINSHLQGTIAFIFKRANLHEHIILRLMKN